MRAALLVKTALRVFVVEDSALIRRRIIDNVQSMGGFDVVGSSLRYRGAFRGFVDELEPQADGYLGRATFRGREFGRFAMERILEP